MTQSAPCCLDYGMVARMDDVLQELPPPPGSVPTPEKMQQSELSPEKPPHNNVWLHADEYIEMYDQVKMSQSGMSTTLSRGMTEDTNLEAFPGIVWQWHHREGWRDYDQRSIVKIETAYRKGESKVRVRTGKQLGTPMELFFVDMLQHDPISKRTRGIRRVGPWRCCDGVRRFCHSWIRVLITGRPRHEVFADYEKRRKAIKEDIDEREYNVAMYYKKDGCLSAIVTSPWFFALTMLAVLLNTAWLSIDSDYNNAETLGSSEMHFQLVEHMFCVFFTVELLLRFGAFERKRDCIRDNWFSFDLALALIMILEIWILPFVLWITEVESEQTIKSFTALRLMRLLRLTRIARLLRAVPEVLTLLKGISVAFRGVATTLILLGTLTFVFGIIFKKQSDILSSTGELAEAFKSVWASMVTLCFVGTLLDGPAALYKQIDDDMGRFMALVFLVFIFLTAFTVLNMLIGVLCQVITEVSQAEHEDALVDYLKEHLLDILDCYDTDRDKTIGRKEFDLLLLNLEMREALAKFDTDIEDLAELAKILFSKSQRGRLSFKEILNLVLRLKSGNTAQVTDIVDLREYVRQRSDHLEMVLCKLTTGETYSRQGRHATSTPHLGSNKPVKEEEEEREQEREQERPALRVAIRSARGLRNADWLPFTGKSDSFCQCMLVGKPHSMVETTIVRDDLDPEWNEEFVIMQYTPGDLIKFTVLDQDNDYFKSPDFLGSVVLQAGHYEPDGFDGELQLEKAGHNREAFLSVKLEVMSAQGSRLVPSRQASKDKPPALFDSLSEDKHAQPQPANIQSIADMLGELCKGQQALRAEVAQLGDRLEKVERCMGSQV